MAKQIVQDIGIVLSLSFALALGCASGTPRPAHHRTAAVAGGDQSAQSEHHHDAAGEDHAHHEQPPEQPPEQPRALAPDEILAAERVAYERARPVFDRHCAKCHTGAGKNRQKRKALPHFNMDTYPFGGHHATEMAETIREVLGATGKDATMPMGNPGTVQGDELALILAWAEAFERSHKAGLHDHTEGHQGHGGHQH